MKKKKWTQKSQYQMSSLNKYNCFVNQSRRAAYSFFPSDVSWNKASFVVRLVQANTRRVEGQDTETREQESTLTWHKEVWFAIVSCVKPRPSLTWPNTKDK